MKKFKLIDETGQEYWLNINEKHTEKIMKRLQVEHYQLLKMKN